MHILLTHSTGRECNTLHDTDLSRSWSALIDHRGTVHHDAREDTVHRWVDVTKAWSKGIKSLLKYF